MLTLMKEGEEGVGGREDNYMKYEENELKETKVSQSPFGIHP